MSYLKEGDFVNSLKRITFIHLSDVYELLESLWSPETQRCKLLIIDSLATLFLPILGDSHNDGMILEPLPVFQQTPVF